MAGFYSFINENNRVSLSFSYCYHYYYVGPKVITLSGFLPWYIPYAFQMHFLKSFFWFKQKPRICLKTIEMRHLKLFCRMYIRIEIFVRKKEKRKKERKKERKKYKERKAKPILGRHRWNFNGLNAVFAQKIGKIPFVFASSKSVKDFPPR